jgi:hypothetical protein
MCHTRRPEAARKSRLWVVLSVVKYSLGATAALVLVGGAVWSHGWPTVAGPEQGSEPAEQAPEQAAPPVSPPRVGEVAPDFTLRDLDGKAVRLSDYRGRLPVVIEFGSITCPIVTGRAGHLDRLAEQYRGKAEFWFVYANEEHPGHGETRASSYGTFQALPQVQDHEESCERARLFRSTVKTSRRILVDDDGAASVAARYGIQGHGLVVVDTQGRLSSIGAGPENLPDLDDLPGASPSSRPAPPAGEAASPGADAPQQLRLPYQQGHLVPAS